MGRRYHFISGLPRAGSTLLSSILKQNPRFTSGISDPVQMYAHSIIKDTNTAAGMDALVDIDTRRRIIRSIFDSYYSTGTDVCFNTNRGWASDTALLNDLYPNFKMIVCLRDIPWILDSFEKLNAKNPYTIKPLYNHQDLGNIYERCHMLMGNVQNFGGYVAGPLANVRQSMFSAERNQLCYIEYDTLVKNPKNVMKQIYQFLNEPWFEHDFDNVEDSYDEFDTQAKITGLHSVRKKVQYIPRTTVLPDDLINQYEPNSFWKYNFNQHRDTLNWITTNHIADKSEHRTRTYTTLNKQL